MNLSSVPTNELLRRAYAEIDLLTSADLERELLRRLEASEDDTQNAQGFLALAQEYDLKAEEMRAIVEAHVGSSQEIADLLALLNERDIHRTDDLEELLDNADEFRSLANDAGSIFSRLNTLFEKTLED